MSLFPKARPSRGKPQVRRRIVPHACVESGQSDHRGTPICAQCGGLKTAPVHRLPDVDEAAAEIDARRLGEGSDG